MFFALKHEGVCLKAARGHLTFVSETFFFKRRLLSCGEESKAQRICSNLLMVTAFCDSHDHVTFCCAGPFESHRPKAQSSAAAQWSLGLHRDHRVFLPLAQAVGGVAYKKEASNQRVYLSFKSILNFTKYPKLYRISDKHQMNKHTIASRA